MLLFEYVYALAMFAYRWAIYIMSFKNEKARLWIEGRAHLWYRLHKQLDPKKKKFWIHCASLGEFEQVRVILDRLKESYPDTEMVLTFFSPSGYEVRKKYNHADHVLYLPVDSRSHARLLTRLINPRLAIFVKYEFWYFYYKELHLQNVPLIQVSSMFRKTDFMFRWYAAPYRNILGFVDHFFVQDPDSGEVLADEGIRNYTVIKDTRFDRVAEVARRAAPMPLIEQFIAGSLVGVGGSTYSSEEKLLHHLWKNKLWPGKWIIAPHEVDEERLAETEALFAGDTIRYSQMRNNPDLVDKTVLIIDRIGLLSSLYRYGNMALVGGGFRNALHNVLEPAAMGLPVITGPQIHRFPEAERLQSRGALFTVSDAGEIQALVQNRLQDSEQRRKAGEAARTFVQNNTGGSETVIRFIRELLPAKKPVA